jgi:hypothetical protein
VRSLTKVAAADQPLVVLLQQQHPARRSSAASLGKIPTTSERRPISRLTRSSGLVLRSLGREPVEGQQILLGVLHQPRDLGRVHVQLLDDLAQPNAGLSVGGGGEDAADGARHQRLLRPANVAQHVAQEVDGAA